METSSSSEDEDSEEEAGEEGMNRQTTVNKSSLSLAAEFRQGFKEFLNLKLSCLYEFLL